MRGFSVSDVDPIFAGLLSVSDVGLIFVVYPEAVATIGGASFWSIIFFFMIITLGLDTTVSGLQGDILF